MIKKHFSEIKKPKNYKSFGFMPNGNEILCFTLFNKNGMECDVINFGATISSVRIPVENNEKVDVVLGFENIKNYIKSFNLPSAPYLGALVGRYAGRINKAQFELNNQAISLNKNHGKHNLHGGYSGFSVAFWNVISVYENSITLEYKSHDKEENFPGELTTQITYTITDENELKVEMTAISTKDTIVNLTQHSYFNLDGHQNNLENQTLFVNSKKILETNSENIPTGSFVNLENHKFDFSNPKKTPNQIDNTFVLENNDEVKATLFSKNNNLKMLVFTNQPAVHIYVGGNCFNQIKGKENANYHSQSGICFETQNFPDAPNHANFPSAILRKDETYHHKTTFKFEKI